MVFLPGPVVKVPEGVDTSAPEEIEVDTSVDMSRFINPDFGDNRWRHAILKIGDHKGSKGFHNAIRDAAMAYISCCYDPQAADPLASIEYTEFEKAVLERVASLKLTPQRQNDLDDRLQEMERCFWGALPRVQKGIRERGFIATPTLPPARTGSLAEMMARATSEAQGGV
jgi:hypothetical protein